MGPLSPLLALGLAVASLLAPPELPPEPETRAPPPTERGQDSPAPPPAPAPGRTSPPPLPPEIEPIPFPLEQRRAPTPAPPPTDASTDPATSDARTPAPQLAPPPPPQRPRRRSVIDLRDPFDNPPRQAQRTSKPMAPGRLLIPDLKDPFAPSVRRIRSKRLDVVVPNDIRDPFRNRPRPQRPRCAKTTEDGTVVQTPGDAPADCSQPPTDLRDPFDRD